MRSNKARAGALAGGLALCGALFAFAARFDWVLDILDVFDLAQGVAEINEIDRTSTAIFSTLNSIQMSAEIILTHGTPTLTPTPAQSPTPPSTPSPGPCSPSRVNQPLPELTTQLQAAVEAAGLLDVDANAQAFGEGCVEAATGAVRDFTAMTTNLYFTAFVDDLTDDEALGDLIAELLVALNELPLEAANINVEFTTERAQRAMRFTLADAQAALERELTGAALMTELDG